MKRPDVEAIQARAEQATAGPWQIREEHYDDRPEWVAQRTIHTTWDHGQLKGPAPVVTSWVSILTFRGQNPSHGVSIDAADAQFIATARTDVPALCAYAVAVEAEATLLRDTLREVLSEFILGDLDRNLWLASGLVNGETMARWRSVAGLGAATGQEGRAVVNPAPLARKPVDSPLLRLEDAE